MQKPFSGPNKSTRLLSRSFNWGMQALLLITVVCMFVPFSPGMPGEGLDPSWVFGMNQAVAQGLAFGRDIVFTFGPYASIYTKTYHPATDHLMVAGSLYLGLSFWLAVFLLTRNSRGYLVAALWAVLAGLMYTRDTLLFIYPLLVGILCFKSINSNEQIAFNNKLTPALTSVLFIPFGLLPLIKGPMLIMCGATGALAFALFAVNKRWGQAVAVVASPIVSIMFFWVASGQSLADLPQYFISMAPIISGYTEAMAINGFLHEIILFIAAAAVAIYGISGTNDLNKTNKAYLVLLFSCAFFLVFKAGFVRHDAHALLSSNFIFIGTLLLLILANDSKWKVGYFAFSLSISAFLFFLAIATYSLGTSYIRSTLAQKNIDISEFRSLNRYEQAKTLFKIIGPVKWGATIWQGIRFTFPYTSSVDGIVSRSARNGWLDAEFNNTLKNLGAKAKFPLFEGTTDIYSYNQSDLIASGNNWNPRPIFQSYSVYTPSLVLKNKNHLLGESAPDNVIFAVEPIDSRIPSIEDGASWPVLLTRYQPGALENDFLYLHKKPLTAKGSAVGESFIGKGSYSFASAVPVPSDSALIFAEISIKQTAIGKLINLLYKPSQLQISLNLENGTTRTYRIISGMANSGLLISPLIENTAEFAFLYGGAGYWSDKKVKTFSIEPAGGKWQWENAFEVTFKKVPTPERVDISKLVKLDSAADVPGNRKIVIAEQCDGSIDFVNGVSPPPAKFSTSRLLNVHGWLAKSADQGLLPESVLLVLSDGEGRKIFFNARQTPRPDVGAFFKNPALSSAGFASTVDVSMIGGDYLLGLAFAEGDRIKICPQFKIPGTFKGATSHE
jgi:hypothetical protein